MELPTQQYDQTTTRTQSGWNMTLWTILAIGAAIAISTVWNLNGASADSSIEGWYRDSEGFVEAMEKREKTDQPVVLYFYADWCAQCKHFKKDKLADKEVQAALDGALKVAINAEAGEAEGVLFREFNGVGYPTFAIIPPGADKPIQINTFQTRQAFIEKCRDATSAQS